MRHFKNPAIFRILTYLEPEIYSELCSRHFLAYSECCVTPVHWEPCHIQNFTPVYLGIFLHILAYSISVWAPKNRAQIFWNKVCKKNLDQIEKCILSQPTYFSSYAAAIYNGMTEKTYWMRLWIVIITFTFFFSTLILNNFQRNLKRHVFWLQWRQCKSST